MLLSSSLAKLSASPSALDPLLRCIEYVYTLVNTKQFVMVLETAGLMILFLLSKKENEAHVSLGKHVFVYIEL